MKTLLKWPKRRSKYKELNLGDWCSNQRARKHRLSAEEIKMLDEIGFPWEQQDLWGPKYDLLKQYRNQNPKQWPTKEERYEDVQLGSWCSTQRQMYRKKKLEEEKIRLLNDIGFSG